MPGPRGGENASCIFCIFLHFGPLAKFAFFCIFLHFFAFCISILHFPVRRRRRRAPPVGAFCLGDLAVFGLSGLKSLKNAKIKISFQELIFSPNFYQIWVSHTFFRIQSTNMHPFQYFLGHKNFPGSPISLILKGVGTCIFLHFFAFICIFLHFFALHNGTPLFAFSPPLIRGPCPG
jgi:hypothetical protein